MSFSFKKLFEKLLIMHRIYFLYLGCRRLVCSVYLERRYARIHVSYLDGRIPYEATGPALFSRRVTEIVVIQNYDTYLVSKFATEQTKLLFLGEKNSYKNCIVIIF